ncbi:LysR substrate-binding domain-containing protein [Alcaligenes faecalis]|uniref:LysR substrate-binding domain-containing protein n=1 Tax=Alcaligenes faecalis TaxID=511 RepID=UPI002932AB12|nr:LysR substrate-binding domain-containing protein [Alcaligenes faecalis]MDV2116517.1 LysR substrate-binding domain-containing protein [Alcaligenes faecalis]
MHHYHKWLRSFYAVAYTGGFTSAARYLSIGQPTVSEQVRALEQRFDVELFYRSGNQLALSAAGKQLYEITRPLFDLEEEAVQLLESFKQRKSGLLRIGAVSPPIAMDLVFKLGESQPDIEFKTYFSSASKVLEKLYDFDVDVAMLAHPKADPSLYTRLYQRYPVVAVVPEKHPWCTQEKVSLEQLSQESVILREAGSRTRQTVEEGCARHQVAIHCVMELNSREAIVHAIMKGVGIGFVSAPEYVDTPGTRAICFEQHPFYIDYYLCCLELRKERPLISDLFKGFETSS